LQTFPFLSSFATATKKEKKEKVTIEIIAEIIVEIICFFSRYKCMFLGTTLQNLLEMCVCKFMRVVLESLWLYLLAITVGDICRLYLLAITVGNNCRQYLLALFVGDNCRR
jgi:hypothetical protein